MLRGDYDLHLALMYTVLHGSSAILMTSDVATSRACKDFFILDDA